MTAPHLPGPPTAPPITSGSEFLLVVFRTFGGFGILFACLILLLRRPVWHVSAIDATYWVTVAFLLVLYGRAAHASGSIQAWHRTRWWAIAMALLLWGGAQSVHPIP